MNLFKQFIYAGICLGAIAALSGCNEQSQTTSSTQAGTTKMSAAAPRKVFSPRLVTQIGDGHRVLGGVTFIDNDTLMLVSESKPKIFNVLETWQISTGKKIATHLTSHTDTISAISVNSPSKLMATAAADGTARLWDTNSLKELHCFRSYVLDEHKETTYKPMVALSPDGKLMAMCDYDSNEQISGYIIRVFDTGSFREMFQMSDPELIKIGERIDSVAFSPDGRYLVTILPECYLSKTSVIPGGWGIWDVQQRKLLHRIDIGLTNPGVAFFSDESREMIGAAQNGIYRFNVADGQRDGYRLVTALSLAASPDGYYFASGGSANTTTVWRISDFKKMCSFGNDWNFLMPGAWVDSLAYSPDGQKIAVGGYDGIVRIWSLYR